MLARIVAMALLPLLMAACASPRPPESAPPTDRPVATPEPTPTSQPTPAPSLPAWFGEALLVVGSTGEFSDPAERAHELPAWLVVWRDGVVSIDAEIGSEPQTYRSIEIDQAELAALEMMLQDPELIGYVHDPAGDTIICRDCNDTVIQGDADGRFVEVIVLMISEEMGDPPGVEALAHYVAGLWARAARSEVPWVGTTPTVLAAPTVGG